MSISGITITPVLYEDHLRCICSASCVQSVCETLLVTCGSNGSSCCDCQCHDHAGLLSCQAQMHQPWQGSSQLTAPALQAWVIVVRMMEDEDGEVSNHILLLCIKSVEPFSRQPQAIGRQPQTICRQPKPIGRRPLQNTGQLVLCQGQLCSNSSIANLKEAYSMPQLFCMMRAKVANNYRSVADKHQDHEFMMFC